MHQRQDAGREHEDVEGVRPGGVEVATGDRERGGERDRRGERGELSGARPPHQQIDEHYRAARGEQRDRAQGSEARAEEPGHERTGVKVKRRVVERDELEAGAVVQRPTLHQSCQRVVRTGFHPFERERVPESPEGGVSEQRELSSAEPQDQPARQAREPCPTPRTRVDRDDSRGQVAGIRRVSRRVDSVLPRHQHHARRGRVLTLRDAHPVRTRRQLHARAGLDRHAPRGCGGEVTPVHAPAATSGHRCGRARARGDRMRPPVSRTPGS